MFNILFIDCLPVPLYSFYMSKKTEKNAKLLPIVVIGAVILIPLILLAVVAYYKKSPGGICTMEARVCSDGAIVSRSGIKCEFEACPSFPNGATVIHTNKSSTNTAIDGFKSYTAFTAEEFAELKNNIGESSNLLVYPELDFSKEFVFAIADLKGNSGYSYKLKSIQETENEINIIFNEISPGPDCSSAQVMTSYSTVVRKDTPAETAKNKKINISVIKTVGDACIYD
jgi:hypothetical protein